MPMPQYSLRSMVIFERDRLNADQPGIPDRREPLPEIGKYGESLRANVVCR